MAKANPFDRLKLFVRTVAMNGGGRTTTINGGRGARRWWERAFAAVLILIAIVVAILVFWAIVNYCPSGVPSYWAGSSCQKDTGNGTPPWWPIDVQNLALSRLNSGYPGSSPEIFTIQGGERQERYLFYTYTYEPQYLLVAVRSAASSYGSEQVDIAPNRSFISVCKNPSAPIFTSCSPVLCEGPARLRTGTAQQATWGFYCLIERGQDQDGYNSPAPYPVGGAYRVLLYNDAPPDPEFTLQYTYVANCQIRYPRGAACPDKLGPDELPRPPGTYSAPPGYSTAPPPGYSAPPPSGTGG
jgi:hypothetical protein